jgi:glyoxylase-like metal-dependent hydrolase (beta-lactamase superfamily II)
MRANYEYVVVIARYGTRTARRSEVFLNYGLYAEDDGPIGMDYFAWIVRNAERTILVDTGFSRHGGESRGRELLVDPPELYARLGVRPELQPPVVVTHAHYDHIGNLALFPTSRVVIAERELGFWDGPLGRRAMFHHSVEDSELAHLARLRGEGRLTVFDDRHQVAPGVEVIRVGGHTPGQSVVRVNTAEGVVLIASDAVHYYEELERDMPFSSVVSVADMYAGFDLIREMTASGEVDIVVTGHDPSTLARFSAATGDLSGMVATIGGGV